MTNRPGTIVPTWARIAVAAVIGMLLATTHATADPWNDKTTLKFSSPVMVPGATLQPGEYVFRLMDLKTDRHIVQIFNSDESRLIATSHAVPVKRLDPKGASTLTFAATEGNAPLAVKAWYYPGTLYGHEFIYSGEQAKKLTSQTKTIVLTEGDGSDVNKGSLRVTKPDGTQTEWQTDEEVRREWADWMTRQRK